MQQELNGQSVTAERSQEYGENNAGVKGQVCNMLHNLDTRKRAFEIKMSIYFIPDSGCALVKAMLGADKSYDDRNQQRVIHMRWDLSEQPLQARFLYSCQRWS